MVLVEEVPGLYPVLLHGLDHYSLQFRLVVELSCPPSCREDDPIEEW